MVSLLVHGAALAALAESPGGVRLEHAAIGPAVVVPVAVVSERFSMAPVGEGGPVIVVDAGGELMVEAPAVPLLPPPQNAAVPPAAPRLAITSASRLLGADPPPPLRSLPAARPPPMPG